MWCTDLVSVGDPQAFMNMTTVSSYLVQNNTTVYRKAGLNKAKGQCKSSRRQ